MKRLLGPAAVLVLGLSSFLFFATGVLNAGAQPAQVSTTAADVDAGHALFIEHCASCHGVDGQGVSGKAPALTNSGAAAADFYLRTGRMPLNNPRDQAVRRAPFFDESDLTQLVAYVASLGSGPSIPTVAPVCSATITSNCTTLAEGQQLYELNCAQCHNAIGAGGMLSKGDVIPSLKHATATEVAEAVRIGPQPMPVFSVAELSDHQVSAIANYVQFLRKPPNRGGLGIGHFGPIPEGFVGIIIGLGLMLVASRLIGTRG